VVAVVGRSRDTRRALHIPRGTVGEGRCEARSFTLTEAQMAVLQREHANAPLTLDAGRQTRVSAFLDAARTDHVYVLVARADELVMERGDETEWVTLRHPSFRPSGCMLIRCSAANCSRLQRLQAQATTSSVEPAARVPVVLLQHMDTTIALRDLQLEHNTAASAAAAANPVHLQLLWYLDLSNFANADAGDDEPDGDDVMTSDPEDDDDEEDYSVDDDDDDDDNDGDDDDAGSNAGAEADQERHPSDRAANNDVVADGTANDVSATSDDDDDDGDDTPIAAQLAKRRRV
jgi:hypothetical protein